MFRSYLMGHTARICLAPEGDGGAPPAAAAGAPPAPPPEASKESTAAFASPPAPQPGADGRPAHVREQFWDPATKAVKVDDLAKSYNDIQSLVTKRASELNGDEIGKLLDVRVQGMRDSIKFEVQGALSRDLPKTPADYALVLDPVLANTLPAELRDLSQFKDDPMLQAFQGVLHKHGVGNAPFQEIVATYMKALTDQRAQDKAEELQALGSNGKARVDAVGLALGAKLSKDEAAAVMLDMRTAAAISGMEKLLSLSADPTPGAGGGTPPSPHKYNSIAEVRAAMADDRYRNAQKRDPAFVAEIDQAFKRLSPGQQAR